MQRKGPALNLDPLSDWDQPRGELVRGWFPKGRPVLLCCCCQMDFDTVGGHLPGSSLKREWASGKG